MSYNLFLDDQRTPNEVTWVDYGDVTDWVIVRSYEDFISVVRSRGAPSNVSFDHDLEPQHYPPVCDYSTPTGKDCARFLLDYCYEKNVTPKGRIFIHSLNTEAPRRILIDAMREHLNSRNDPQRHRIREIYE